MVDMLPGGWGRILSEAQRLRHGPPKIQQTRRRVRFAPSPSTMIIGKPPIVFRFEPEDRETMMTHLGGSQGTHNRGQPDSTFDTPHVDGVECVERAGLGF